MQKMYLFIACYLCVFFGITNANAQSATLGTIQIGSGSETNTGSTAIPVTNFGYNYSQQIVRASEYSSSYGLPGTITKIRYYVTSVGTMSVWNNWTVYLGNTNKESFVSNTDWVPVSEMQMVFSGNITATANNWFEITLDTPFQYTGGNIVIAIDENTAGYNVYPTFRIYTSNDNTGILYRTDTASNNPDPSNPPTASERVKKLPQIQFVGTVLDCIPPLNLTHSNVSSSQVQINLGEIISEGVMYSLSQTNTPPTGTLTEMEAGISNLTFSNLLPNTTYYLWYKKVCTGVASDIWKVYSFTTLCSSQTLPYSQNFDSYNASQNTLPTCWYTPVIYSGYPKIVNANPNSSPNSLRFQSDPSIPTFAVTPSFFHEVTNLRVRFALKREGASSGTITVGVMSDPLDPSTFVAVSTITPTDNNYKNYTVNLVSSTLTGTNRYVAFRHNSVTNNFYYWIDDVIVEEIPGCLIPENLQLSNILKNGVTISWQAPEINPENGYEYEIRTSGLPGSGSIGLVQFGDVSSLQTTITNLVPSTTYDVYLRSVCTADNKSNWTQVQTFTTLCDYPDVTSITVDSICGIGTADIEVVPTDGIVQWFSSQNQNIIHTGNTFTTPELDETTSFYYKTGLVQPNTTKQLGFGTSSSRTGGYSPLAGGYGGYKTQYIYTAQELNNAGIFAGIINSIGFDVTATTSVNRNGFTIHIGTTEQDLAIATHISNLDLVYSNESQPVQTGINAYEFENGFDWDGVSNIVVQVSWSNNATSASGGDVKYHSVGATRTTYTQADNRTPAQVLATITGGVANDAGTTSGSTVTSSNRANTYFNGMGLCNSPYHEVEVEVSEAPALALSTNTIEDVCQGNDSSLVTIVSGASNYDTYEWVPSEGVFGNAEQGFYFNIHEDAVYTLKAMNSVTGCRYDQQVTIDVNLVGYTPLAEEIASCGNEVISLDVTGNGSLETISQGELLASYDFNSLENSGWTHNNLTGTTTVVGMSSLPSEGQGYLRFSHENTSTGNITSNESFNGETSRGLMVEFKHMAILEGNSADYGTLEYSLDNGATWVVMNPSQYVGTAAGLQAADYKRFGKQSYTDWNTYTASQVPSVASWKQEKFVLFNTQDLDLTNVKFRFSLKADVSIIYYGWLLDDVKISTIANLDYTWNSELPIYVDQQATQLYNGESVAKVYVKPTQSGDVPVHVTVSNGACTSTDTVMIHVPEIVIPDFTSEQYCDVVQVNEMTFVKAEGHTYTWYNSQFSTEALDVIPFTGNYFVQITIDGCSSERIQVPVFIVGNAQVVVSAIQKFCDNATVSDLHAVGSHAAAQINWYTSADATTPMSTDTALVSGTTYYVSQTLFGCESERIAVLVEIFDTPVMLVTNQIYVCNNTLVRDVIIDGQSNLKWYYSQSGGVALSNNHVLTSGVYYIAANNDICESERLLVTVNVVQNLPAVDVSLIDICGAGIVSDLNGYVSNLADGAVLNWYPSSTSTVPLLMNSELYTGTYYVEQKLNDCTSVRKAVAVRVVSKVAPIINSQVVCSGTKVRDIVLPGASSVTYKWYTTPTSLVALGDEHVFTTGMYYVIRNQFGCESSAAQVFVDVKPLPNSPTGSLIQELEEGSVISDIVMNSNDIVWYISETDALYGINPLDPNMPIVNGTTYYGVLINEFGCPSIPTAVTVNLFLGINDLDISKLNVYPNPTVSVVTISYNETIDRVEVYSLLGQKVIDQKASSDEVQLDLTHLSSGTYMIKISVGSDNQLVKIVKK